jgi:predicted nuclease of restriction endonuclease-like RecB superfamily
LPGERIVQMSQRPLELAVAAAANVHVLQTALRRALLVRIEIPGDPRPLARAAARQGLLATVRARDGLAVIEISGPLALFHRTTVYGRALGALVPALASCASFALTIRCNLGRGIGDAVVTSPVLLPAYKPPPRYAAELRLERDLRKLLPDAAIDAAPGALASPDGDVVFPDLTIRHGDRTWCIEVVGFWTADHVLHRLAQYNAAGSDNIVLCVDSTRGVADGDLTLDPRIVRFHGRIDPSAVLAAIG